MFAKRERELEKEMKIEPFDVDVIFLDERLRQ